MGISAAALRIAFMWRRICVCVCGEGLVLVSDRCEGALVVDRDWERDSHRICFSCGVTCGYVLLVVMAHCVVELERRDLSSMGVLMLTQSGGSCPRSKFVATRSIRFVYFLVS